MNENLYELLILAKSGDKIAVTKLYEHYKKNLYKFNKQLNSFYTCFDLNLFFVELLNKINLNDNLKTNQQINSYAKTAFKNEYIKLSKKNLYCKEFPYESIYFNNKLISNFYSDIEIRELINRLNPTEEYIIKEIYFKDKPVASIAKTLHISRQAVNKRKLKALNKLRNYI